MVERKPVGGLGMTLSSLSLSLSLSLGASSSWASLPVEKPSQTEESSASESRESRELIGEAGLEECIAMAWLIEPLGREACPALAGIFATAKNGDGWTAQDAGMIQKAAK